VDYAA